MGQVNNDEIFKAIRDGLKINNAIDAVPNEYGKTIVPVFIANPIPTQIVQTRANIAQDSLSEVIHTTHATKRTFVVVFGLTYTKDVNALSVSSNILATLKGAAVGQQMLEMRYEPTTAGSGSEYLNLTNAIELEKDSEVKVTNSNAGASIDTRGIIYFYELENN